MKKITLKNKILILLSFVFLFISSFAISTFAYHEDSDGNLVSDNLYSIGSYSDTSFGVSMSISNQTLTLNGTSFDGFWNNRHDLSLTLNAGTYTMQWFTTYIGNDIGFGLRSSNTDLTELYQLNSQRYKTFTISETTTFTTVIWWQRSNMTFNNVSVSCMVYSGNYKGNISFEPYGSIYYSTNTLNRLSRNIYGPYAYVTNIDLFYNNGSSSSLYKSYSNIYDLSLESFVKFRNQCIEIDDYKFIFTTLGGNSSWKFTLNFTFANSSLRVSDFNEWYFYGPIPYNFTFSNSSSLSGTSSDNPLIVNLTNSGITSTTFISSFSFTRNNPNIGLAITKVGTPNSTLGYDNGYITGHDDAIAEITEYYKPIIQQYKDNINTLSERISYLENGTRNYTNLIWTIGATPWESFKNIWNVEFGGINIANIVTGLVTALLVIYLIKKIWK